MRFKSNKGTNQSHVVPHAGTYMPHVAHGVLKKMRALNYNTTGKKERYIHKPDVELMGDSGSASIRDGHE